MDLPLNVDVFCEKELCGKSTRLIMNPENKEVTHIVVAEKAFPHAEKLVPVSMITQSTSHGIWLRCSAAELKTMDDFVIERFVSLDDLEEGATGASSYYLYWPANYIGTIGAPGTMSIPYEVERVEEQVPEGEISMRRGVQVRASDGPVGKVDELLMDPATNRISHLVMREGHLWGAKEVIIPVSEIAKIEEEVIYLKLSKEEVAKLPATPYRRKQD